MDRPDLPKVPAQQPQNLARAKQTPLHVWTALVRGRFRLEVPLAYWVIGRGSLLGHWIMWQEGFFEDSAAPRESRRTVWEPLIYRVCPDSFP